MSQRPARPERTARTPALARSVTFNSDFVIRVYKRTFDHIKGDIFLLTVRTRSVMEMAEAADQGEQFIEGEFAKVKKDLIAERERILVLLKDRGLTRDDGSVELPTYPSQITERAEYTSPQANEYLKILELMDVTLQYIDTLWLNNVITPKERTERAYQYQRRLIKIANRVRDLGGRCKKKLLQQLDTRNRHGHDSAATADDASAEPPSSEAQPSDAVDLPLDVDGVDLDEASADREFDSVVASADSEEGTGKPNGHRRARKVAVATTTT